MLETLSLILYLSLIFTRDAVSFEAKTRMWDFLILLRVGKIKFLTKRPGERYASALTSMHLSNKVYKLYGKIELKNYINSIKKQLKYCFYEKDFFSQMYNFVSAFDIRFSTQLPASA